ncbi:hypothetical protein SXCC_01706 [Gluconacetobacter sp. SXCC-1]|nr:hypothetical protein SXCC_01706 [Gluconacetobacter sp. SXCC-1]
MHGLIVPLPHSPAQGGMRQDMPKDAPGVAPLAAKTQNRS